MFSCGIITSYQSSGLKDLGHDYFVIMHSKQDIIHYINPHFELQTNIWTQKVVSVSSVPTPCTAHGACSLPVYPVFKKVSKTPSVNHTFSSDESLTINLCSFLNLKLVGASQCVWQSLKSVRLQSDDSFCLEIVIICSKRQKYLLIFKCPWKPTKSKLR